MAAFGQHAQQFSTRHKGNLVATLGTAISEYADLDMLGNKIMVYLSLQQSLDVTDEAVKTKVAEVQMAMSRTQGEYLTFFELELVALDDSVLERWYAPGGVGSAASPLD